MNSPKVLGDSTFECLRQGLEIPGQTTNPVCGMYVDALALTPQTACAVWPQNAANWLIPHSALSGEMYMIQKLC